MEFNTHQLSNGIRLIHKPVASRIAHAGLFINAGSRDEKKNEHGLAHFIEHALFKGTAKRKSYHIISRLEDVGGDLNAYTTKEETCVHASFLKEYTDRAIELISDIVFHSTFPEKELEKEKEIVIDEINSYKDNPSELIFDDFEEILFPDDPLGLNILGTPATVKDFSTQKILSFIKHNYQTDKMVLSVVGDFEFKYLVKIFERYFSAIPKDLTKKGRKLSNSYKSVNKSFKKNTFQAHCVVGNQAFSFADKRRLILHLLNNILGGPGMNSKLNLSLRERHGCSYNVESSYNPYCDTGTFMVYFGTDKENIDKCMALTMKEFELMREKEMGAIQLSKAKKQLLGQLAIGSEHNENLMLSIGRSYLIFDKVDSLDEINRQIEAITAKQLRQVANEILTPQNLSSIIYK